MSKNPSFRHEKLLWKKGYKQIVGLDEVGRGAFAGPLVAAAVILPKKFKSKGIKDSKLLTPMKRELFSKYIIKNVLNYSISEVSINYINKHGVGEATHKAFRDCLKRLKDNFDFVLVDGFKIKGVEENRQEGIIHGDRISVSIAAASIIAKVYRDNLMVKLHRRYPLYNFAKNKGYGTKFHRQAIKNFGLCKIHRKSFDLKKFL